MRIAIGSKRPAIGSFARIGLLPRLARAALRFLFGLLFRPRLEGVLPESGPYLVAANHQGWADAFLVLALFPAEPRVHFVGDRRSLTSTWWRRLVLGTLGGIVHVDRDGAVADRSALDGSLRVVSEGGVLGVFPEGRVSRAENELGRFRRGIGYLAMRSRVPVLPVWLRGSAELYLGRELVVRVGKLRFPPAGEPTKEATEAFASQVHDDVARLMTPWEEAASARKWCRWLTTIL